MMIIIIIVSVVAVICLIIYAIVWCVLSQSKLK